ncbi:hypothetical protein ET532_015870 [Verminephrobacter sp. Larva24]|nr:hypothetical protein ET532_015870 [Verminephrobacter sp. Larva24]
MFARVLVANRGEIALRIVRALHDLGLASVAVYAADDAGCQLFIWASNAAERCSGGCANAFIKGNVHHFCSVLDL